MFGTVNCRSCIRTKDMRKEQRQRMPLGEQMSVKTCNTTLTILGLPLPNKTVHTGIRALKENALYNNTVHLFAGYVAIVCLVENTLQIRKSLDI